jgi:mycothiol synthase
MPNRIEYYTPASISDDILLERAAHANRMLAERLPDDPPLIPEDAVKRMRALPSITRLHVWVLRHDGRIVAQAYIGWQELESNRQSAGVEATVEPHLRRRGIGSRLVELAVAKARQFRRSLLFAHSCDRVPAGRPFLERLGFKPGLAAHVNQLALDRLDRELLVRWLTADPERAADYAVELWDGPVPENRLAAFADLSNVMNGEPRGELELEDTTVTPKMIREEEACLFANGSRRIIACARHVPSGMLVGFTELFWNPKRAAIVWQCGTGVVEGHRNRGLGRWLKAANMETLLRLNPAARFVRSGNADSNAPMLAINQQMGFAPFIAETAWQGRISTIARRLRSRTGTSGVAQCPATMKETFGGPSRQPVRRTARSRAVP